MPPGKDLVQGAGTCLVLYLCPLFYRSLRSAFHTPLDPLNLAPLGLFALLYFLMAAALTAPQTGLYLRPLKLRYSFKLPSLAPSLSVLAKLLLLCISFYRLCLPTLNLVPGASLSDLVESMIRPLLLSVALGHLAIGLLEAWWQQRQNHEKLKMSRSEIKREALENEGNPSIKAKRQGMHKKIVRDSF